MVENHMATNIFKDVPDEIKCSYCGQYVPPCYIIEVDRYHICEECVSDICEKYRDDAIMAAMYDRMSGSGT